MNNLAADIRGLIGHAARLPLAYGVGQYYAYDGKRFWGQGASDIGCFLGTTCAAKTHNSIRRPELPQLGWKLQENCCPKLLIRTGKLSRWNSTIEWTKINLGMQNLTYHRGSGSNQCSVESAIDAFPFMASGEIVSRSVATSVAECKYASEFVERAIQLSRSHRNHPDNSFIPGVDAISGHFWNRCLKVRTMILASLPLLKFHHGNPTIHMTIPTWRQSVIVHGLKFYVPGLNASIAVEHAYNLTSSQSGTIMPPIVVEYTFATPIQNSMIRHASMRAARVNTFMLLQSGINGFSNSKSPIAQSMNLIQRKNDDNHIGMRSWQRHLRRVSSLWNSTTGEINIRDYDQAGLGSMIVW